ncbi:unnamed protein product [Cylindrotheca closterium]|uniref:Sulfotransferase n=1 Tax=Cylindrotheca closterium TaxID=2856 RepID=A0AAD2CP32_9STRA|nr:unnamed protein product [Cylindrotheca closterium]
MRVRLRRRKKSPNQGKAFHIQIGFMTCCLLILLLMLWNLNDEIDLKAPGINHPIDNHDYVPMKWPKSLSITSPAMYFIHVGKAGGMTLRMHLPVLLAKNKKELGCWKRNESNAANCLASSSNNSALTNHIRGHMHIGSSFFSPDEQDFLMNHTDTFLFSIRNPIDRVTSAFYYHQNQKIKYPLYKCFNSMNELVYSLGKDNTSECSQLARRVLQGNTTAGGAHFAYNYEYYEEKTIQKKPNHYVTAIRAEHLWQDAKDLDKMVGGTGVLQGDGQRYTHYSASVQEVSFRKAEIASKAVSSLCCVLAREMVSYTNLVSRAVNLKPSEKHVSLQKVQDQCNILISGSRSSFKQLVMDSCSSG